MSYETTVNMYAYTPFGVIAAEIENIDQPFKYVGQHGVMAEDNGLYYMRARYYDPEVGRFISEDPIGFDGGDVNVYAYVGNNPLLLFDPLGEDWVSSGLGVVSYGLNTWGLATANPYVKGAGTLVSAAAITYSGVQYKLGNMSGTEATLNIVSAAGDIGGPIVGKFASKTAGTLITGISRGTGIANTATDVVRTTSASSNNSASPIFNDTRNHDNFNFNVDFGYLGK